jgi:hypothetical protein
MLSSIHKALIDVLEQQEAPDQRVATGKQPENNRKQPESDWKRQLGNDRDTQVTAFLSSVGR